MSLGIELIVWFGIIATNPVRAAEPVQARFDRDYATVWRAVVLVLEGRLSLDAEIPWRGSRWTTSAEGTTPSAGALRLSLEAGATPGALLRFSEAPKERRRASVRWPLLEADETAGVIRSDWREERQPKRWDRLLTQRDRRHRLELRLRSLPEGTEVSVALRTQSRPMGRYSAPWQEEAPSQERVHALLDAIERALAQPGPVAASR